MILGVVDIVEKVSPASVDLKSPVNDPVLPGPATAYTHPGSSELTASLYLLTSAADGRPVVISVKLIPLSTDL